MALRQVCRLVDLWPREDWNVFLIYLILGHGLKSELPEKVGWVTSLAIGEHSVGVASLRLVRGLAEHDENQFFGLAAPWSGLLLASSSSGL